MGRRSLMILAVATFALTFLFAYAAGAQETTTESEDGADVETQVETPQQPLVFAEGKQARTHLTNTSAI